MDQSESIVYMSTVSTNYSYMSTSILLLVHFFILTCGTGRDQRRQREHCLTTSHSARRILEMKWQHPNRKGAGTNAVRILLGKPCAGAQYS